MTWAKRIPVLMYHRVGATNNSWERRYCVSPQGFAAQTHHLAKVGMRACGLTEFFDWLAEQRELPAGSFLLTFDDGFLGVHDHAVPVLQALGWPATVFLVSGLVGRRDEWCQTENPSGATYPLMGGDHIAALRKIGFTFQSHTRYHVDLLTLGESELVQELASRIPTPSRRSSPTWMRKGLSPKPPGGRQAGRRHSGGCSIDRAAFHARVEALPLKLKNALVVKYVLEWPWRRAKHHIGCPYGTYYYRLAKARSML